MTTMIPDLVVGEVGFGPNFCGEDVNLRLKITELEAEVAGLKREVAQYKRGLIILRKAIQGCAALSDPAATAKHEALLQTDPKNLHHEQENR
jgi:hypothetical protein